MSQTATKIRDNQISIEEIEVKNALAVFEQVGSTAEKFCQTVDTMKGTVKRKYFVRRFCPMVGEQTEIVSDFELFMLIQYAEANGYSIPNGEVILYKRRQKTENGQWGWGPGVPMPTEEGILRKFADHPLVAHVTRRLAPPEEIDQYVTCFPVKMQDEIKDSLMLGIVEVLLKDDRVIRGEGPVVIDADSNSLAKSFASSIAFDIGLAQARAAREAYDTLKAIPVESVITLPSPADSANHLNSPAMLESQRSILENTKRLEKAVTDLQSNPDLKAEYKALEAAENFQPKKFPPEYSAADYQAIRNFVRPYKIKKEDFKSIVEQMGYENIEEMIIALDTQTVIEALRPPLDLFARDRLLRDEIEPLREIIGQDQFGQFLGNLGFSTPDEISLDDLKKHLPALRQAAEDRKATETSDRSPVISEDLFTPVTDRPKFTKEQIEAVIGLMPTRLTQAKGWINDLLAIRFAGVESFAAKWLADNELTSVDDIAALNKAVEVGSWLVEEIQERILHDENFKYGG